MLPKGEELKRRAAQLGVDTDIQIATSVSTRQAPDHELQRRVLEAERSQREHRLWIVALVSAIFSILAAIAAWVAALKA